MLKLSLMIKNNVKILCIFLFLMSCSQNNFTNNIEALQNEDFYLGIPGSKLFYRTTTKKTQEQYHYAECNKKFSGSHQVKLESCVTSYWIKAKTL